MTKVVFERTVSRDFWQFSLLLWRFFSFGTGFHVFKLLLLGVQTNPSTFLPDCSIKICEKPSKFAVGVLVVNDYADSHLREYLRENDKFCKTFYACSCGAQVEFFFDKKKIAKISWHCPFKWDLPGSVSVSVLVSPVMEDEQLVYDHASSDNRNLEKKERKNVIKNIGIVLSSFSKNLVWLDVGHRRKKKTEEKAKVVAVDWGTCFNAAHSIFSKASIPPRYSSPYSIHPFIQILWCKIASAAKNLCNSVPQSAATT